MSHARSLRLVEPASAPSADADARGDESDATLVRRVAEGDLSPLGVLFDRHHEAVRQFIARASTIAADADDLTQETFLVLAKIAGRYDGRASARPFLLGIAAQLVRRRRRTLQRWAHALAGIAHTFRDPPQHTPEKAASTSEELRLFDAALRNLTEEKRIVFLLVEREGLSGSEVATALGIPVNTVWTRLHHARRELCAALAPERGASR